MSAEGFAALRKPFPPNQIGRKPQPYKADSAKGNCKECGGYHGLPAIHLDFVGHAALTDRLLDVDPAWTWEPMAVDSSGAPLLDKNGGMWIRLTVLGVSRPGYGDAQGKSGGNAVKEAIGDALRNAGMRFGLALDLWHKGDLHAAAEQAGEQPPPTVPESLDGAKRAVAAEWRRLGMTVEGGKVDYTVTHDGLILADADLPVLTEYLATLRKAPTSEALPV